MRKLMLAALLAFSTFPALGAPPQEDPVAQAEQYDRSAVILDKDGNVKADLGAHEGNPFKDKAACEAGIEEDTAIVTLYLLQRGADVTELKVVVSCTPSGKGA